MSGSTFSHWIAAARLRTLPLAFAGIILGSFLGGAKTEMSWPLFIACLFTALCFQILSNYANDLGDALKGTDEKRIGEKRMVSSGLISANAMKHAVILFSIISLMSAGLLSYVAFSAVDSQKVLLFILLGVLSVGAALKYTLGKKPYGYARLGELAVFFFFGWLAVGGSYFIQTKSWDNLILLPASAVGLLAAGVLHLNNMRDIENDRISGKYTLAGLMGLPLSKSIHFLLVFIPINLVFIYNWQSDSGFLRNLFILSFPLFVFHLKKVSRTFSPSEFDPQLKVLAISTFVFSLLLGIGHLMN